MFFVLSALLWGCQVSKKSVVPTTEVVQQEKGNKIPDQTKGISSVEVLGYIDLREEFPELHESLFFRLRTLTIAPQGTVALHEHKNRPGVAYILKGAIKEYRGDEALIREAGQYSFEYSGIQHGWENHTQESVEAIVVDVLEPEEIPSLSSLPTQQPFAKSVPKANSLVSLTTKDTSSLKGEGSFFIDKKLRLRVVSVAPNGVVGAHTHNSRPSFAYMVSGTALEHRGDADYNHQAGSAVAERNGLSHWWENKGDTDAVILVVDIIPENTP